MLSFNLADGGRVEPVIGRLVLAGFAGRSAADVEAHIEEMARQGVKRPPFAPMLWPVAPRLITQGAEITVYGPDTVAEVEYVLFAWQDRFYVTVGNDQCDIEVERELSSEKSKNLCPKVLAGGAWPLDDVLAHWDDLELRLACNGTILQQDRLAALIRPETLLAKLAALDGIEANGRMGFSGTIASKGAYPPAPYCIDMTITDPLRGREIRHGFTVTALKPLY